MEYRGVWDQVRRAHEDEIHQTDSSHLIQTKADPEWKSNTPGDIQARDQYISCLLVRICKTTLKTVNDDSQRDHSEQAGEPITVPRAPYKGPFTIYQSGS